MRRKIDTEGRAEIHRERAMATNKSIGREIFIRKRESEGGGERKSKKPNVVARPKPNAAADHETRTATGRGHHLLLQDKQLHQN